MLEKPEGAIKNEQSTATVNIGLKIQMEDKQTQHGPHRKQWVKVAKSTHLTYKYKIAHFP
jgi:hypothetical protein